MRQTTGYSQQSQVLFVDFCKNLFSLSRREIPDSSLQEVDKLKHIGHSLLQHCKRWPLDLLNTRSVQPICRPLIYKVGDKVFNTLITIVRRILNDHQLAV